MRVVVLAGRGSRFAATLLDRLARESVAVLAVVEIQRNARETWKMLRSVAGSTGWPGAARLAAERWISERSTPRLCLAPLLRSRGTNSDRTEAILRALQPDVVALAQVGLVGARLLSIPRVGTLNGHPGWLPDYRGLDPGRWAIRRNEANRLGASVHWVDRGIDTGPILSVTALRPPFPISLRDLDKRLDDLAAEELSKAVARVASGEKLEGVFQTRGDGRKYGKMGRRDEIEALRILRGRRQPAGEASSAH